MNKEIRNITLIGLMASLIYSLLVDDWSNPAPPINALIIGPLGGFLAGILEVRVFAPGTQRISFTLLLFLRTFTYFILLTCLVIIIKARVDSWFLGLSFRDYYLSDTFQQFLFVGEFRRILLYAFAVIAVIIFFRQLNRYLGRGMLKDLILGKYHLPREETRVFLLIDLQSSTSIAEQLDEVAYYKFLNLFFSDVTIAANASKASIYRYVGDQITFTWQTSKTGRLKHVPASFFAMKSRIRNRTEEYERQFGLAPKFRGTAIVGKVMTGEIGDLRSQIIFQGNALLEGATIEKVRTRSIDALCLTSELYELLPHSEKYVVRPMAPVTMAPDREVSIVEMYVKD